MQRLHSWLAADARRPVGLALLGLIGLSLLAFFNQLGGLGLMDKTEGLFVEVPRQMLRSGDWITPRWNGDTFFDYPVWGYWMVGLSFRLFGVSEWAARLPAALAATATALALFAVVLLLAPAGETSRRSLGRASLCASLLVLSPGWVGWGRSSVTDMFLASGISLSLLGFALAWGSPERPGLQRLGHGAMALFAAVAVLAKGPVGLLLPALVIGSFLLLKGQLLRQLRSLPWLAMAALFVGVAGPWYVLATQANGATFINRFLGFSNLERFTSVLYAHPGPPWFYLPWLVLLLLPWSLYLPLAIARLSFWQLSRWRQPRSPLDLPLLALLWLVLIVAFFSSAATKLPGYILPSLPAGALLVGLLFQPLPEASPSGDSRQGPPTGLRISAGLNALLLALMAVAAAISASFLRSDPSYPGFAAAVSAAHLPLLLALPLALGALALVLQLAHPSRTPGLPQFWIANAASFAAVLALVVPVLVPVLDRERQLPIRQLARGASQLARPGEPLLVVGYKRYSVVFYSGRPVLFVSSAAKARDVLGPSPASTSVLLLGSEAELQEFGLGPADGLLLQRSDAHRLVRLPIGRLRELGQP
jgi:4-amino-4-deoxy-L-arabinose transferase-like glycosyltransferase